MRAVSAAHREHKETAIPRYLAVFGAYERSALDSFEGPDDLYLLFPCRELHAVSRAGVYGRKHARAVVAGLREIVCANRNPVGQHAGQEEYVGKFDTN